MQPTDIKITAQDAINKMLDSFELQKKGFRTLDEHLAFCQAIKTLFDKSLQSLHMAEPQKPQEITAGACGCRAQGLKAG